MAEDITFLRHRTWRKQTGANEEALSLFVTMLDNPLYTIREKMSYIAVNSAATVTDLSKYAHGYNSSMLI